MLHTSICSPGISGEDFSMKQITSHYSSRWIDTQSRQDDGWASQLPLVDRKSDHPSPKYFTSESEHTVTSQTWSPSCVANHWSVKHPEHCNTYTSHENELQDHPALKPTNSSGLSDSARPPDTCSNDEKTLTNQKSPLLSHPENRPTIANIVTQSTLILSNVQPISTESTIDSSPSSTSFSSVSNSGDPNNVSSPKKTSVMTNSETHKALCAVGGPITSPLYTRRRKSNQNSVNTAQDVNTSDAVSESTKRPLSPTADGKSYRTDSLTAFGKDCKQNEESVISVLGEQPKSTNCAEPISTTSIDMGKSCDSEVFTFQLHPDDPEACHLRKLLQGGWKASKERAEAAAKQRQLEAEKTQHLSNSAQQDPSVSTENTTSCLAAVNQKVLDSPDSCLLTVPTASVPLLVATLTNEMCLKSTNPPGMLHSDPTVPCTDSVQSDTGTYSPPVGKQPSPVMFKKDMIARYLSTAPKIPRFSSAPSNWNSKPNPTEIIDGTGGIPQEPQSMNQSSDESSQTLTNSDALSKAIAAYRTKKELSQPPSGAQTTITATTMTVGVRTPSRRTSHVYSGWPRLTTYEAISNTEPLLAHTSNGLSVERQAIDGASNPILHLKSMQQHQHHPQLSKTNATFNSNPNCLPDIGRVGCKLHFHPIIGTSVKTDSCFKVQSNDTHVGLQSTLQDKTFSLPGISQTNFVHNETSTLNFGSANIRHPPCEWASAPPTIPYLTRGFPESDPLSFASFVENGSHPRVTQYFTPKPSSAVTKMDKQTSPLLIVSTGKRAPTPEPTDLSRRTLFFPEPIKRDEVRSVGSSSSPISSVNNPSESAHTVLSFSTPSQTPFVDRVLETDQRFHSSSSTDLYSRSTQCSQEPVTIQSANFLPFDWSNHQNTQRNLPNMSSIANPLVPGNMLFPYDLSMARRPSAMDLSDPNFGKQLFSTTTLLTNFDPMAQTSPNLNHYTNSQIYHESRSPPLPTRKHYRSRSNGRSQRVRNRACRTGTNLTPDIPGQQNKEDITSSCPCNPSDSVSSTGKTNSEAETDVVLAAKSTSHASTSTSSAAQNRTKQGAGATGEHVCPHCFRRFTRSDMLVRHKHVHTGDRPFCCAHCGQKFSRSDHLSTHQRTHTGHRPYTCQFCPYSACRRDMITRHMRVHQRRQAITQGQLKCLRTFPGTDSVETAMVQRDKPLYTNCSTRAGGPVRRSRISQFKQYTGLESSDASSSSTAQNACPQHNQHHLCHTSDVQV